jgi:hypothetical protein
LIKISGVLGRARLHRIDVTEIDHEPLVGAQCECAQTRIDERGLVAGIGGELGEVRGQGLCGGAAADDRDTHNGNIAKNVALPVVVEVLPVASNT